MFEFDLITSVWLLPIDNDTFAFTNENFATPENGFQNVAGWWAL